MATTRGPTLATAHRVIDRVHRDATNVAALTEPAGAPRLADALAVPVAWFFTRRPGAGPLERAHVVRAENRRNLNLLYGEPAEESGYTDWLLSSTIGGDYYFGISEYAPRSEERDEGIVVRDGEQHCLVLEGEIELVLRDEVITLRAGDSYSIRGDIPHRTSNKSDQPARMIWVNSPVIIPRDHTGDDPSAGRTGPSS